MKTDSVPTQWLLDNLKTDYKVIYVGDASMHRRSGHVRNPVPWVFVWTDQYAGSVMK